MGAGCAMGQVVSLVSQYRMCKISQKFIFELVYKYTTLYSWVYVMGDFLQD
jgi:hypothetical protein